MRRHLSYFVVAEFNLNDSSKPLSGTRAVARVIGQACTSCSSVSPSPGRNWNPMNLARFPVRLYGFPFAAYRAPRTSQPTFHWTSSQLFKFPVSLWLDN